MATTSEIRERVAAEVRAELARQKVTQREVGEFLDLVQPAVQLRLAGKRPFRVEELITLADKLGVPVARFIPDMCEPVTA